MVKIEKLQVGKGGLPPPRLSGIQTERGQAALPNCELFLLKAFSVISRLVSE